jgi:hypothetical protein
MFTSTPDHAGLFLRAKAELFIKSRHAGTEPDEFDFLEARVVQDTLHDIRAYALALVCLIDDHIPDGRPVDEVREYPSKSNQHVTIPGCYGHVSVAQHLTCVLKGPSLSPRRLLVEANEFDGVEVLLFSEGDGGLEGWGHLVLDYLLVIVFKFTRSVRGTS